MIYEEGEKNRICSFQPISRMFLSEYPFLGDILAETRVMRFMEFEEFGNNLKSIILILMPAIEQRLSS